MPMLLLLACPIFHSKWKALYGFVDKELKRGEIIGSQKQHNNF
jgi:hypothetical protein